MVPPVGGRPCSALARAVWLASLAVAIDMEMVDPVPHAVDIDIADDLQVFLPCAESQGPLTLGAGNKRASFDDSCACSTCSFR